MLFSQSGEHPTEGKLKISGPVSATVEFVQGGVYLNGTFYTWDEIEEKTEDEFGDDMFPECNFS